MGWNAIRCGATLLAVPALQRMLYNDFTRPVGGSETSVSELPV